MTGDDITHNLRTVAGVPLRLHGDDVPPVVEIRGEVYMTNTDLADLNARRQAAGLKLYANTRNTAAGGIRAARPAARRASAGCDSSATASATARALPPTRTAEFLEAGRQLGRARHAAGRSASTTFAAAVDHCESLIGRLHEFDFEVDGLVLKVDRFDQRERLGATSKAPRWLVAYKFEKYEATTRVNNIFITVGKSGALTPTADLEPVQIAGTTVSRVSLHNVEEIARKDVRIGDTIVVEKAGKIIPHVVRVEKHLRPDDAREFVYPTHCPACDTQARKGRRRRLHPLPQPRLPGAARRAAAVLRQPLGDGHRRPRREAGRTSSSTRSWSDDFGRPVRPHRRAAHRNSSAWARSRPKSSSPTSRPASPAASPGCSTPCRSATSARASPPTLAGHFGSMDALLAASRRGPEPKSRTSAR